MELVDVLDSKSCVGNYVPVRPRPSANISRHPGGAYLFLVRIIGVKYEKIIIDVMCFRYDDIIS